MENQTENTPKIGVRILGNVVWYAACTIVDAILRVVLQQETAQAAVGQLADSNGAFYQFQAMNHLGVIHAFMVLLFLGGSVAIWHNVFKRIHDKLPSALYAVCALIFALMFSTPAHAYYDKTDRAEWVNIEANQSAFLIPATGANKTNQAQFGSIDYLAANKVAAKRVQIPHIKADNTSAMFDYFVPNATLYVVDRTPYTREWVNATDRGTSTKKEGFRFETADSINVMTGITISASVSEEDAAKFFYNFGTTAVASSQDPATVFASVKYGKSLAEVMDTVVRGKVQQIMAKEFAKRSFMKAIGDKASIIDSVEQAVKDEFAKKGITIAFVGYAEELSFDDKIQQALNSSVIAAIQYANKDALLAVVEINRKNAEIDIVRAQAKAIGSWNGQINFPFILPDSFVKGIMDFVNGSTNKK